MQSQNISSGKGDICWSAQDKLLLVVGEDLIVKTFSLQSDGKVVTRDFFDMDSEIYAVHSAGERTVLAGEGNQALEAAERNFGNLVPFVDYRGVVREVRLDQAGIRAGILGDDKDVIVYHFGLKKKLRHENTEICGMLSCNWSPNGEYLATVSKKGTLTLFKVPANFEKLEQIQTWRISDKEFRDEPLHAINPVFTSDSQILVGGKDVIQKITLNGTTWEYSVETRLRHAGVIYSVTTLPNGLIVTIGHDKSLKIFNPSTEVELASHPVADKIQRADYIQEHDLFIAFGESGNLLSLPNVTKLASSKPAPVVAAPVAAAAKPDPFVAPTTPNPYVEPAAPKQPKIRNKFFEDEEESDKPKPAPATVDDDSMRAEFAKLDKLVSEEDASRSAPFAPEKLEIKIPDSEENHHENVKSSVPKSAGHMDQEELSSHAQNGNVELPDEDNTQSVAPEPSYQHLKRSINREEELHVQRMVGIKPDMTDELYQQERRRAGKVNKIVEEFLTTAPQKPSRLQGTTDQGKRNYLCYNTYGKVVTRLEGSVAVLDIEYSLQELSKKLVVNRLGYNMASMSYRGVLLASTGFDADADEYLNEEDDPESRYAHLNFIPASGGSGWTIKLDDKENITSVVLGQSWAAVTTSRNFLRLFYLDSGKNYKTAGCVGSVVGLAAYEQYLAMLFNTSMPFSGQQCQSVRVFNTSSDKIVYDSPVVLSPKSKAKWFGFSDEGSLCLQDTGKVLWSLVNENLWVPIYDGANLRNDFFVITVTGAKIMLIRLPEGSSEPNPLVQLQPVLTDFKLPLHMELPEQGKPSKLIAIWNDTIRLQQEAYRTKTWGHSSAANYDFLESTNDTDLMAMNRANIMKPEALQKLEIQADRERIDFIRLSALERNEQDVIQTALNLTSMMTVNICCKLLDSLGQGQLSLKIREEIDRAGRLPATPASIVPFTPRVSEQAPVAQLANKQPEAQQQQAKEQKGGSFKGLLDSIDENDVPKKPVPAGYSRETVVPKKQPSQTFDLIRDAQEMTRTKR